MQQQYKPIHSTKQITIEHARVNNLRDISVSIPRNAFTVITGVSGSGKSSLAFDTLYAEGQRRFVESLSAYARQFLDRMNKPDVERISGLPPAIAIEQRAFARNPRSTVATTTEIYDYLRLLYGRVGHTICTCGREVRKDTPQHATQQLCAWPEGSRVYLLFPPGDPERTYQESLQSLIENGYFRAILPGSTEIVDLNQGIPENAADSGMLMLADRVIIRTDQETVSRITDSLETAFMLGHGRVQAWNLNNGDQAHFSTVYECAFCSIVYKEPEPRLFSFNSPFGACPTCQGFGRSVGIDESLVIPDTVLSLRNGAIAPFRTPGFNEYQVQLLQCARRHSIPTDQSYAVLNDQQKKIIWQGDGIFGGINGFFEMANEKAAEKMGYRVLLSKYRGYTTCTECAGSRLRRSARRVFVGGLALPQIIRMNMEQALEFFRSIQLSGFEQKVVGQVLKEICSRLEMLVDIGLAYITLDRLAHTLSGGESQRINLATSLGSSLVGTLYVLDEPSIGLHARDTWRLLRLLRKLRSLGNTVVVVEHDPEIIAQADYVVDIGPRAGEHGGTIIFSGTVPQIKQSNESLTGAWLSGKKYIDVPKKRSAGNGKTIQIINPVERNLKGGIFTIPLGCITVITGVSGSGKSTLVHDILYAHLRRKINGYSGLLGAVQEIKGIENIQGVEMVDQSAIGKSSRSTPVTYTNAFDAIREIFADTPIARQMGWKAGAFSFNVAGGRCESCEGDGYVTVEMQFLPDITLECETCKGTRYKKEVRDILFKGKSIVDVLNMTVQEAVEFFRGYKKVVNRLQTLMDVGLGYLKLGQPSSTLSGGEAQRIKLATCIDQSENAHTLYIFDEPTTGLHLEDIATLLLCFRKLVEKGHSVLIIEHNLHIIASADYIIDLGPEAGELGGTIVGQGTPEKIASIQHSYTGQALKPYLSASKQGNS
jgi:excinuclease ABC subunit A